MTRITDLLIIGAGPFGLALAAQAQSMGIDHLVAGKPMAFWIENMPKGMVLRSGLDWHFDPTGIDTIEAYAAAQGLTPSQIEPITLERYLDYGRWFQRRKAIATIPAFVERLDSADHELGRFRATMGDGSAIDAAAVAIAIGFKPFKHVPAELAAILPDGRYGHTCDEVDFSGLRGKRVLIIGGRQGAYEWAALVHEAGAAHVHLSHRHAAPAFTASDWSWVAGVVDAMVEDPGWFRRLPQAQREAVSHRLWAEGRLKIEPWLKPRVEVEGITAWPETRVARCDVRPNGALAIALDSGQVLEVDHVILASGYRVDLARVPFLAAGDLLSQIATRNGYPELDEHFQASVPGLYITSMPAGQDFGPFFGFTISVRASAKLIGASLAAALRTREVVASAISTEARKPTCRSSKNTP